MTTRKIGIRLEADVGPLRAGLEEGTQALGSFEDAAKAVAASLDASGDAGAAAFQNIAAAGKDMSQLMRDAHQLATEAAKLHGGSPRQFLAQSMKEMHAGASVDEVLGVVSADVIKSTDAATAAVRQTEDAVRNLGSVGHQAGTALTDGATLAAAALASTNANAQDVLTAIQALVGAAPQIDLSAFASTALKEMQADARALATLFPELDAAAEAAAKPILSIEEATAGLRATTEEMAAAADASAQSGGDAAAKWDDAATIMARMEETSARVTTAWHEQREAVHGLWDALGPAREELASFREVPEDIRPALEALATMADETEKIARQLEINPTGIMGSHSLGIPGQGISREIANLISLDDQGPAQSAARDAYEEAARLREELRAMAVEAGAVLAPVASAFGDVTVAAETATGAIGAGAIGIADYFSKTPDERLAEALASLGDIAGDMGEVIATAGSKAFDSLVRLIAPADQATEAIDDLGETASKVATVGDAATEAADRIERMRTTSRETAGALADFVDVGAIAEAGLTSAAGGADAVGGRALGGIVGVLRGMGPLGLAAAAAIGVVGTALFSTASEAKDAETALAKAGGRVDLTAQDLVRYTDQMEAAGAVTRDEAQAAVVALTRFGTVAGKTFEETLELAQALSSSLGIGLVRAVGLLGTAAEAPVETLDRLTEAGLRFSDAERQLVRELTTSGRVFDAQRAILDAVRRDMGGESPESSTGLTGAVNALQQAWRELLGDVNAGPGIFAGAAQAIVDMATRVVTAVTDIKDEILNLPSKMSAGLREQAEANDELARQSLLARRQALEAPEAAEPGFWDRLSSFELGGFFDPLFDEGRAIELRRQSIIAERERIDAELADLDRRAVERAEARANAEAEALATEQQQRTEAARREAEAEDQRQRARLEQLKQALSAELTYRDAYAREREALTTRLSEMEYLRDSGAISGEQLENLNAAIERQKKAIAELGQAQTAATAPARAMAGATHDAVDANLRLIEGLEDERRLLQLTERDRAVERAVRRLSADATADQVAQVRELAGALYDERAALEQSRREAEVLKRLREQLAEVTSTLRSSSEAVAHQKRCEADRAAAQAVAELGEAASTAAQAEAEELGRRIYYQREGLQLTEQMLTSQDRFAREVAYLDELLAAGAVSADTYARAHEDANRPLSYRFAT